MTNFIEKKKSGFVESGFVKTCDELVYRLECSSEKGEDIVNCLSRQTQQDIIKASNSMAVSILIFPIFCSRQHLATPNHPPLQLNISIRNMTSDLGYF